MVPLVEKYRPDSLQGFVGLEQPRAILGKLAAEPYSSAWLLLGGSGLGKTTMALALAKAIGGELHHIPSRKCDLETVDRVTSQCHYVPMSGAAWHVILIDEADKMTGPAQLAFLSKLDGTAPPPDTIFVFTANSTKLLEARFLSRCRVVKFVLDDVEPALGLLARVWAAESSRPAPDFGAMLRDAGFNIRTALNLLEVELMAEGSFQPSAAPTPPPCDRPSPRPAAARHRVGVDPRIPAPGTILRRQFRDRQLAVEVLVEGFQFEGRTYTSLSAIAREVAQGNRNGFTFFGLGGET